MKLLSLSSEYNSSSRFTSIFHIFYHHSKNTNKSLYVTIRIIFLSQKTFQAPCVDGCDDASGWVWISLWIWSVLQLQWNLLRLRLTIVKPLVVMASDVSDPEVMKQDRPETSHSKSRTQPASSPSMKTSTEMTLLNKGNESKFSVNLPLQTS